MSLFSLKVTLTKIPLWRVGGVNAERDRAARAYHFLSARPYKDVAERFTPIGASGDLADSITVTKGTEAFSTVIGWNTPYAEPVAEGSRPHWAPIGRLAEWVLAKIGDPDLIPVIQETIALRGTRDNPFQKKTQAAVPAVISTQLTNAIINYVRGLTR
jgi:hypothetical protein